MSTGRTTDDRDLDSRRHREIMAKLERIELGLTAAGLLVVRDPDRKPDILEEWKPKPTAWTIVR